MSKRSLSANFRKGGNDLACSFDIRVIRIGNRNSWDVLLVAYVVNRFENFK